MLSTAQVQQFHRDGFLPGPQVLEDDQVEALRGELKRVIDDKDNPAAPQPVLLRNLKGEGAPAPVWQVVNIWMASEPFHHLVHHAPIVELIAQLTNASELRLWHDQIQYKPAETGGVNMWHQDWPYWPTLHEPHQVTAWIALDDVDADNGCMSMVPGSHTWGNTIEYLHTLKEYSDLPREWEGHAIERRLCPVRKGHVHFHHGLTWHGSHANTSGRPRRAIALHYMTQDTLYATDKGFHPMEHFVKVEPGSKLEGEAFPLVWRDGRVVKAPAKELTSGGKQ